MLLGGVERELAVALEVQRPHPPAARVAKISGATTTKP